MLEAINPTQEAIRNVYDGSEAHFSNIAMDKEQREPCICVKGQELWDIVLQEDNMNGKISKAFRSLLIRF